MFLPDDEPEDNLEYGEEFQVPEFVDEEAQEANFDEEAQVAEELIEGADSDEEGEGAVAVPDVVAPAVVAPVAPAAPQVQYKLPLNVIAALNAYGATDHNAIQMAVSTCSFEVFEGRTIYEVAKITDPVSGELMKFKLNRGSIKSYKTKTENGVKAMARGLMLEQEAQQIQREAQEELTRYGTVLCIANKREESNKRQRIEDTQAAINEENQARAEKATFEAKCAEDRAVHQAKIAKINKDLRAKTKK